MENNVTSKIIKTVESDGRFIVPIEKSTFGEWLNTGLSDMLIVVYRGNHGWKACNGSLAFVKLPGQLYVRLFTELVAPYSSVREICAIELYTGVWRTIWTYGGNNVTYP